MQNYDEKLYKISMTMKRQDMLEKLKHTMQYANTIGGQDYIHLWKTMFKDVGYANNSKLTDHHRSWLTFLLKEQNQRPFANCSMDLIRDLPPVDGYDSILVVVDQGLSKGVILVPCNKTLTSEDTARLLLENLYKWFGLPDKIISDRGPQFASKAFIKLLKDQIGGIGKAGEGQDVWWMNEWSRRYKHGMLSTWY